MNSEGRRFSASAHHAQNLIGLDAHQPVFWNRTRHGARISHYSAKTPGITSPHRTRIDGTEFRVSCARVQGRPPAPQKSSALLWEPPTGQPLPSRRIFSLYAAHDGDPAELLIQNDSVPS